MEMRTAFIIGIAVLLFTMYYLEKEMEKRQIFWLYTGLGIALGLISLRAVATRAPNFDLYITFTVLSILIAILYFEEGEEEKPPEKTKKNQTKKKKKPKKRKSKGRYCTGSPRKDRGTLSGGCRKDSFWTFLMRRLK